MTDPLIVQYMTRLFLEPNQLQRYSPAQVAQGIWFLIGESSPGKTAYAFLNQDVAIHERLSGIQSMGNFFRIFVAPLTSGPADTEDNPLHIACWMWWDIFPTYDGKSSGEAELQSTCMNTMKEILKLSSELCQLSALHGLNHWHPRHPHEVEQTIDIFLHETTDLTPRVLEYARIARAGAAQ